jgi:HemY protein
MMRFLFLALATLIATVGLAVLAYQDPGYVLIARTDWALETSLAFFLVTLLVGFALLYAAIRVVLNTWRLPGRVKALRRLRRTTRARRISERGFIALAEGRWKEAEHDLARAAPQSDNPLVNYLTAARAAQRQGASQRRDHYLTMAHQAMPGAELAIGLARAEAQLSHNQLEQALAILLRLRELAPKQPRVMYLLAQVHEAMGEWGRVAALVPELRGHAAAPESELDALEARAQTHLLDAAGSSRRIDLVRQAWAEVPKTVQKRADVTAAFARNLACLGEGAEAEALLRDAIRRQWDAELVRLYGQVRGADPGRQLATAEGWLKQNERSAVLLLTLGRICLHHRLWGKARTYLEASLGLEPRAETYRELAVLLQQFKEHDKALDYFRTGLEMSVGSDACTSFKVEEAALARRG